jgi:REP element-mobilizing transposase RayT
LVAELTAKLFGSAIVFPNIENAILENNLYGVDINEESVEIAKLALWLRTAKPHRKLNSLNNNIKCGNSLISPSSTTTRGFIPLSNPLLPEIEKAFDWHKEFPQVFTEKNKKAFHVTTAIHDSRTSQRMIDYKVRERRFNGTLPDPQVYPMDDEDELFVTKTIVEIVKEDKLNVLAYNICCDHLHILLVCEDEELDKIVGKIKGRTARAFNIHKGINPLVKKEGKRSIPLWTQKFGRKEITDDKQLYNTIEYIQNNRIKHELPNNKGIHPLVEKILCSIDHAFRPEYKGGFDVVIGNPPYFNIQTLGAGNPLMRLIQNVYSDIWQDKSDILFYFIHKALEISKSEVGYIVSNAFLFSDKATKLRNHILKDGRLAKIINFEQYMVFSDENITS